MLILYVREIEINIRSFNCLVHLRQLSRPFCAINVSYYQKCSQAMSKWNAKESLISFGPETYFKNVIKGVDIFLKSSLKIQEMPFKRLKIQRFSGEAGLQNP